MIFNISDILFHSTYMSGETAEEAEKIDEDPSVQDPVATKKNTEEPLPSIDPILPITGKYLINDKYYY